jgi:hypothetical protein
MLVSVYQRARHNGGGCLKGLSMWKPRTLVIAASIAALSFAAAPIARGIVTRQGGD